MSGLVRLKPLWKKHLRKWWKMRNAVLAEFTESQTFASTVPGLPAETESVHVVQSKIGERR